MDGGAWWATVHGVAKSQTRLNDFSHTGSDFLKEIKGKIIETSYISNFSSKSRILFEMLEKGKQQSLCHQYPAYGKHSESRCLMDSPNKESPCLLKTRWGPQFRNSEEVSS